MRQFVEILKGLFKDRKVTEETINRLVEDGKISEQEKQEILNAH